MERCPPPPSDEVDAKKETKEDARNMVNIDGKQVSLEGILAFLQTRRGEELLADMGRPQQKK